MKNKPKINFKSNFIILALITIIVVFMALKDDFNDILNILMQVNIWWIIIAIFLVIAYWGFRAVSIIIFAKKLPAVITDADSSSEDFFIKLGCENYLFLCIAYYYNYYYLYIIVI